jgi:hypothetical protein
MMEALTLILEVITKNDDLTESKTEERHDVFGKSERIYQSRIDMAVMQGLGNQKRYTVYGLGELKKKHFSYFKTQDGEYYRISTFQENIGEDSWTLEGTSADEKNDNA